MSFAIDVQALRERASKRIATPATVATLLPAEGSTVAAVAGLQGTTDPAPNADRWCWPHSDAMNTTELNRFTARRDRLLRWGWPESEAEKLAERLVKRDREHDERVSCTECLHYRPGRCGGYEQAGLCAPDVGRDLATMLQRCPGFTPVDATQ